MNREVPRRPEQNADDADLFEAAGDPVLSAGSHRLLEGHLMSEIDAMARPQGAPDPHPAPRPRRSPYRRLAWIAVPVTALAVAATIALNPLGGNDDSATRATPDGKSPLTVIKVVPGSAKDLAAVVDRISFAAGASAQTPGPDQYLYTETRSAHAIIDGDNTRVDEPSTRRSWASPDGSRTWTINGTWQAAEPPTFDPHMGAPTYNFLASLPRDPDALLARIHADTEGQGNGADAQAFKTIGDLIRNQVLPPGLADVLYRTAARIPGVVVVPESTDAIGRTGIALARTDEVAGDRTEWIFDRNTYEFLGERTVLIRPLEKLPAGTVTGHSAALKRSIVDTIPTAPITRTT
ncbi:CU044_5270 family protein [Embleya sp. NPDC050154]|uniref:CU044_5270 family protein n=1 Tax=Embleya sp. NPDC050154 TaxID=3363988 RepID=UPI00378E43BA